MNVKFTSFVFLSLALALLFSCGSEFQKNTDTPAVGKDVEKFKIERGAWETLAPSRYFLFITHTLGTQTFTSYAAVSDNVPAYYETGGAVVVLAPDEFPFVPFAETVDDLYDKIEDAWNASKDVTVSYDRETHTPKKVVIQNYTGTHQYTIELSFSIKPQGEENPVTEEPTNGGFDFERFNAERAAWEARGIKAYRLVMEFLYDYPFTPIRLTVNADQEPFVESFPPGFSGETPETLFGKTVSEFFAKIEADIRQAEARYQGDEHYQLISEIRYNAVYHYPEYFHIGATYDGLPEPGGGTGFTITSFEAGE